MFVGKASAYLSGTPFRYPTLGGRLLVLPTNIRIGWKGLPRTNTLAYYEHSLIACVKSFITMGPGDNGIKILTAAIYKYSK